MAFLELKIPVMSKIKTEVGQRRFRVFYRICLTDNVETRLTLKCMMSAL